MNYVESSSDSSSSSGEGNTDDEYNMEVSQCKKSVNNKS